MIKASEPSECLLVHKTFTNLDSDDVLHDLRKSTRTGKLPLLATEIALSNQKGRFSCDPSNTIP